MTLISGRDAGAQTVTSPTQPSSPPAGAVPSVGLIEAGARATDTEADEARYERYRDLRSGAASKIAFAKETATYAVDARAFNIGYRDQQYAFEYNRHRVRVAAAWDSVPTNYGYSLFSPWGIDDRGVLTHRSGHS